MALPILNLPQITLPSQTQQRLAQANLMEAQAQGALQSQQLKQQEELRKQQEIQQKQALANLQQQAMTDPRALNQLAALSPDTAKKIQDYQTNQQLMIGKVARAFKSVDIEDKPQVYKEQVLPFLNQQGVDLSGVPAQYTPEMDSLIDFYVNSARDIEKQVGTRQITETAQGVVSIDPMTGQAIPITMEGQPLSPYVKPPTTQITNVIGQEQPAMRKKLEETRGVSIANKYEKIENDAQNAVEALGQFSIMEDNLKNVKTTGPLDTAQILVTNLANQIGLPVDMEEIASKEGITAVANKIAIPLVKQLGYNPTDADFKAIVATISGLGKSKDANIRILDLLKQASNKKIMHANIADRLRRQGREEEVASEVRRYDLNNPIRPLPRAKEAPLTKAGKLDVSQLKKGGLYYSGDNVYQFDGVNFIKQ